MARLGVAALAPAVLVDKLTEEEQGQFWLLKRRLCDDLLLRDLGAGAWGKALKGCRKEVEVLLTALKPLGRIVNAPDSMGTKDHRSHHSWTSDDWLSFGHQSHRVERLDVLIRRGNGSGDKPPEVPLAEFESSSWVESCAKRGTLPRTETAFSEQLTPFLRYAKQVEIFDPALDPASLDYQYLSQAIPSAVANRRAPLMLTINRPCYELQGGKRDVLTNWRDRFSSWEGFGQKRVLVRVRIWSDLHDRLLQSNLGGLHLGNGLAATTRGKPVTFSWFSREQAHDAALGAVIGAKLQSVFTIPDGKLESFPGEGPGA